MNYNYGGRDVSRLLHPWETPAKNTFWFVHGVALKWVFDCEKILNSHCVDFTLAATVVVVAIQKWSPDRTIVLVFAKWLHRKMSMFHFE